MLTIHDAPAPYSDRTQLTTGLAIAGGGPVGAIFELGALRALDESVDGLWLHELDVYVGVSAGAFIAAALANRITTAELCRIFMGAEFAQLTFHPERFLRPAYSEYLQRAARVPSIITDALFSIIRNPTRSSVAQLLGELGKAVPSGVFDNETIHDFLEQAFIATGHGNQFDDLECKLYVVAVDLDTGAAVRFGSSEHRDVTISRAVQASAALPGLYPPVEIDGRYYVDGALRRTLHASVALDQGVDLLLGINPLVPYDATESPSSPNIPPGKLIGGGLPLILSQTFRALIQSRMKIGFQKYRSSHKAADLLLVEPDRGDDEIFFTNIFSYSSRNALCEHAYQATRRDLVANREPLNEMLQQHGMALRMDRLKDPRRTLRESIGEPQTSHAKMSRRLSRALDDLEDALDHRRAV